MSSQTPDNPSFSDNSLNGNGAHCIDPGSNEGTGQDVPDNALKRAESVARMVFSFVSGAQDFVRSMDGTDDMRLLRLRTRKNEIMIVPGVYIMSLGVQIADMTGRSQVSPRGHTRCTPSLRCCEPMTCVREILSYLHVKSSMIPLVQRGVVGHRVQAIKGLSRPPLNLIHVLIHQNLVKSTLIHSAH